MGMSDAKNMTPRQRILAMEALWESMCQEETEMDSPEWHEEILDERKERIAAGKIGFVALKQLREHLGR
jgi:hypothetical protein